MSDYYTYLAAKAALSATMNHRHGAVIVPTRGYPLKGRNRLTHKKSRGSTRWSIHAEIAAIRKVPKKYLHGATLYVVRLSHNGTLADSKPCKSCQSILKKLGVSRVYYSTSNTVINYTELKNTSINDDTDADSDSICSL